MPGQSGDEGHHTVLATMKQVTGLAAVSMACDVSAIGNLNPRPSFATFCLSVDDSTDNFESGEDEDEGNEKSGECSRPGVCTNRQSIQMVGVVFKRLG